jgi:hypothetical protein
MQPFPISILIVDATHQTRLAPRPTSWSHFTGLYQGARSTLTMLNGKVDSPESWRRVTKMLSLILPEDMVGSWLWGSTRTPGLSHRRKRGHGQGPELGHGVLLHLIPSINVDDTSSNNGDELAGRDEPAQVRNLAVYSQLLVRCIRAGRLCDGCDRTATETTTWWKDIHWLFDVPHTKDQMRLTLSDLSQLRQITRILLQRLSRYTRSRPTRWWRTNSICPGCSRYWLLRRANRFRLRMGQQCSRGAIALTIAASDTGTETARII